MLFRDDDRPANLQIYGQLLVLWHSGVDVNPAVDVEGVDHAPAEAVGWPRLLLTTENLETRFFEARN